MTVTLENVAKQAGVTAQTVSRVFRSPHLVKESTRQRIQSLARDLGFRPNAAARELRKGLRTSVGLMVAAPEQLPVGWVFRQHGNLFGELCQLCEQEDLNLVLGLMQEVLRPDHDLATLPRMIQKAHVGPVIILSHMWDELATNLQTWKVPAMVINGPACGLPAVQIDEVRCTRELVDHLVQLGHRRIAFINHSGGERGITVGYRDTLWPKGYLQAMANHSLAPSPGWDQFCSNYHEIADRLLSLPQPPTAVITYDDQQLMLLLAALARRGLRVPEDISLAASCEIGVADSSNLSITRMVQPVHDIARLTMQWIKQNLNSSQPQQPAIQKLHAILTPGQTTAEPNTQQLKKGGFNAQVQHRRK
jgi:DNA-binding LacI/PurR family transcriptional regulator